MDNCPICQNELTELSELTGMSLYDLLYWCRNCGTVAYVGGNNASIYPTVLGQQPRFVFHHDDEPGNAELDELLTNRRRSLHLHTRPVSVESLRVTDDGEWISIELPTVEAAPLIYPDE